ncbi:P-loop NTPase [Paenibacillus thermoaerophilus]|uniref:Iron-sulfur cluster carrier protein n=1 Tax=Paenibacillus thermoaerophilus TaxID=1215385 RepID=A0ABW2V6S9_9BACL|nr:Mrp/NBP35 family ATP-binding protein [Paenibacillus thermoaerophilus]TMV11001.1 Mrp/NBP35 family ATP-binding protein [Paenibacillus thermoaerophilus]
MTTREQVLEALLGINDPTFNRPLADLNLIRDIMVKGGQVSLTVVLTDESEAASTRLREQVVSALKEAGAGDVHVRLRAATEHDREQLRRQNDPKQSLEDHQSKTKRTVGQNPASSRLLSPDSGVHYIAVASGKGGVGKSTVTVNLAVALARLGKKVGIIDADIYGFSVPDMMGIEERPETRDDKILPVERFGVKVISMGFFVEDNSPVIWRGPMLGKMLRHFFSAVEWGELEYILLDLPPGTGDVALDVHQLIPHSKEIIVTTPHATAAFVAARAGAMAKRTEHEILGVVENMSYYVDKTGEKAYIFGRGGGAKLAEELHTELLAQIPLGAPDNHISEPDFSPSVYKADTETGRIYAEVAARIVEKLEP